MGGNLSRTIGNASSSPAAIDTLRMRSMGEMGPIIEPKPFGKGGHIIRIIANPARSVILQPQAIQNVEAASRDARGYADVPREEARVVQPIVIDNVLPPRRIRRNRRQVNVI